jgi:hypothetical protein
VLYTQEHYNLVLFCRDPECHILVLIYHSQVMIYRNPEHYIRPKSPWFCPGQQMFAPMPFDTPQE